MSTFTMIAIIGVRILLKVRNRLLHLGKGNFIRQAEAQRNKGKPGSCLEIEQRQFPRVKEPCATGATATMNFLSFLYP